MNSLRRSPRKKLRQTSLFEGFGLAEPKAKVKKDASGLLHHPIPIHSVKGRTPGKQSPASRRDKTKREKESSGKTGAEKIAELFPDPQPTEAAEDEPGPSSRLPCSSSQLEEEAVDEEESVQTNGDQAIISETDEEEEEEELEMSLTPEIDLDDFLGPGSPGPSEPWMGTPLASIQRWEEWEPSLGPLRVSPTRAVLVKVSASNSVHPALPYPSKFRDVWSGDYVRMPCSMHNRFPHSGKSRWETIQAALSKEFASSLDFEDSVRAYNPGARWSFAGFHKFFTEHLSGEEARLYLSTVLPATARLALRLPHLLTAPLPLLKAGKAASVHLSQEQAACLLANAFFATFPRRSAHNAEYARYNSINCSRLFGFRSAVNMAKLRCLLHYFHRVTTAMPKGLVSFTRISRSNEELPDWDESEASLRPLHVAQAGTIEDEGAGLSQLDFANKYMGGGVLGQGAVQEEIRFMICPELLLSCLLCEELGPREAVLMRGAERFSSYAGYAQSFRWAGDFVDATPRDGWERRRVEVLAMDAICFSKFRMQFMPALVRRELVKAWSAFALLDGGGGSGGDGDGPGLATGNWGCGAFGGDLQLKAVIQLMAAAQTRRPIAYFTFGDGRLMKALVELHQLCQERQVTVGQLSKWLKLYYEEEVKELERGRPKTSLFAFLTNHIVESV